MKLVQSKDTFSDNLFSSATELNPVADQTTGQKPLEKKGLRLLQSELHGINNEKLKRGITHSCTQPGWTSKHSWNCVVSERPFRVQLMAYTAAKWTTLTGQTHKD